MKEKANEILRLLDDINYVDLYENIYDEVKYINSLSKEDNYLLHHALHDLLMVLEDDSNYSSEDNSFDEIIQVLKRL